MTLKECEKTVLKNLKKTNENMKNCYEHAKKIRENCKKIINSFSDVTSVEKEQEIIEEGDLVEERKFRCIFDDKNRYIELSQTLRRTQL